MRNTSSASNLKLVILDRDGVINQDSDQYIKSLEEWVAIPGSLEGIALLCQTGFHVVVATNQSGIGRGLFDMSALNAMHSKLHRALATLGGHIDAIFFCPHAADDGCECRKPKPGMFLQIAKRLDCDLQGVPAIGDSSRDLAAAASVGCTTILVRTGKGKMTEAEGDLPPGTLVFDNLAAAAMHLIASAQEGA